MTKQRLAPLLFIGLLTQTPLLAFSEPFATPKEESAAPYLLAGAPTFDQTITQFRTRYNLSNPSLPLAEFRVIDMGDTHALLTRAASKINDALYASTALEKGTGKIKTLQITYLPRPADTETEARHTQAAQYMAALLRHFVPSLTEEQSRKKIVEMLNIGKRQGFYQQTEGALRYVVADNGEKGITFAVEPIKLTLSEP